VGDGVLRPGAPMPEEFVGDAIRDLVMHEVGHTLGLRHNFRSSAPGTTSTSTSPTTTDTGTTSTTPTTDTGTSTPTQPGDSTLLILAGVVIIVVVGVGILTLKRPR